MNPSSWEQAKDVITEALKRPTAEREHFVRNRCADTQLAGEILTLLKAYKDGGDFLDDNPMSLAEAEMIEEFEPGTRVGPYVILDSIGRGGMGVVFLGSDPRLRRKVALKCVVESLAGSGERRLRILHEARAAARVSHPNVATIHDVVEHDNRAFIVMEYVEGESLAGRLKRERLPIDRVIAIGRQLSSALAAAHAKGVVHRDLKPGNVQITADGTVKVLDFGIANVPRAMTTLASGAATTSAPAQGPSRLPHAGTPPYMSPEQLRGDAVDERSDIYSLGVVLFEMATGRRPFRETDAPDLLKALEHGVPRADVVEPRVPKALADLIAHALDVDADARFHSAAAIEQALADVRDRPVTREPIGGKAARVALVMAAIPAVLGSVGFLTTWGFNMTFGRTGAFAAEPLYMYFVWGQRALLPSIVIMTAVAMFVFAGRYVVSLLELIEPIGRGAAALRERGRAIATKIRLDTPAGLAQASTALAIVTLGAMCWYHADLIQSWMAFIDTAPAETLAPLRPENIERLWYRVQLDVIILGFALLLVKVIRLQRRRKTHEGTGPIAMLAAIIALMVLMNEWPYRILSHRDFERVDLAGSRCYITGQSSDEFLLFCPDSKPPRNRRVKQSDPAVRRLGVVENVFAGL